MENSEVKIWYLRKINILSDLNMEEMNNLGRQCLMKSYSSKETILFNNEDNDYIFFLKKGTVRIFKNSFEGKEITIDILKEGDCFGAIYSIQNSINDVMAESITDNTLVCYIKQLLFNIMLVKHPSLSLKLNKLLGLRVKEMEIMLEDLVFKPVDKRLASTLLRLQKKFGNNLPFSHHDISLMIGASREATSNSLLKIKKEGVINTKRNMISIIDLKKLNESLNYN